jgi:DNA-binding XRE family transcriptional regulator
LTTHDDSTAKGLLAELLRLARQHSDHKTQEALARAVGVERTAITRAEGGEYPPTFQVLGDILAQAKVGPVAEAAIRGVWRLAKRATDPSSAAVAPWYETEAIATTLRLWQPVIVPGLLQVEQYAYEIYRAGGRTHERASEEVATRMQRQRILDRDDAPMVVVVLDELVLHRLIGTSEVMAEQCARLLRVSELPTVSLHILPGRLGANGGLGGPVALAHASGEPDVLLMGSLLEDQVTTDTGRVRAAAVTLERVRGNAASITDSRDIIQEALEHRWSS